MIHWEALVTLENRPQLSHAFPEDVSEGVPHPTRDDVYT